MMRDDAEFADLIENIDLFQMSNSKIAFYWEILAAKNKIKK
jgi:hypothetical protein